MDAVPLLLEEDQDPLPAPDVLRLCLALDGDGVTGAASGALAAEGAALPDGSLAAGNGHAAEGAGADTKAASGAKACVDL